MYADHVRKTMSADPLTDPLQETLAVFEDRCGTPLTASEVAETVDLSRRSTYDRLERLAASGRLETKKVGARGRVWWRPVEAEDESTPPWGHTPRATEFDALVDAAEEYAVFELDAEGRVVTWNDGAARIAGYEGETITGEHVSTFYTDTDREAGVPEADLAAAEANDVIVVEGWRVREDGSRFYARVSVQALRDDDGALWGFANVTHDLTERRDREERLRRERDLNERVLESVPIGILVYDGDGRLVRANERVTRRFPSDELEGSYTMGSMDVYDEDGVLVPLEDRPYAQVFETGEAVREWLGQVEFPRLGRRWVSISAAPLRDENGEVDRVVVASEDVTHLKEQARHIERRRDELESELAEVYERIDDAFFALDTEWRFSHVNDRAAEALGRQAEDLIGRNIWEAFDPAGSDFRSRYERAMEIQEPITFEEYYAPLGAWFEVNAYPSQSGLSVYFQDVTERKARERQLERYETIIETVDDGVYALDADSKFVFVNEAHAELTGYDREELVGAHASVITTTESVDEADERAARLATENEPVATVETEIVTAEGEHVPVETRVSLLPLREGTYGRVGIVRDVTERKERERQLEESEQRYRAIAEHFPNGVVAMFDDDLQYTLAEGSRRGERTPDELVGAHVGEYLSNPADRALMRESCRAAFDGRVTEFDYTTEGHVFRAWTVPVSEHDGEVFAGMIMTQEVTEHVERQHTLERQRERLAAMNDLNTIARGITDAVIEQSTREEIESVVCEALAESSSYLFAWIGEVDTETDTVSLRAEAGVDGYADDLTISVDPDDPKSAGPTGRAVITQRVQAAHDLLEDPDYGPWRDKVREYGHRSSAAVPIVHEGTLYGVLNVYASRSDAFEGQEREVIEQLGEIVAHAISAVERKRALMSDEVIELTFTNRDFLAELGVPWHGGRVSFDRTVPAGGGAFIVYGTAKSDTVDGLDELVDRLPFWESVTFLDESDGTSRFELHLDEPPVLSTVTAEGGYFERATIEDGDFKLVIHLSPSADVRRVIDAVYGTHPTVQIVSRRQVTRERTPRARYDRVLYEDLTERQRAAIQVAYFSGYFATPRQCSGEDLAASMGVSAPTFHQHLRRAQEKLLQSVIDADSVADD